ncbi:MAG: PA2779 family protein [Deltaproteobacteria bacterium]|nr:PA2779 family protein [Deltaproteobacteria bacterium]
MTLAARRGYNITIVFLVLITFVPVSLISISANAAVTESQMISPEENASTIREINELKVRRALENKIVAEKLMSRGLTKEEVSDKIGEMSDEQVHQIASLTDRIPAGGDSGLAIVVTILIIVALVLLIVYLYKRV